MKYFLFWAKGRCNDGDCEYDVEEFDDEKSLRARLAEVKTWDFRYVIIKGEKVEESK